MQPMPPQPAPPPPGGQGTGITPGEIVLWASAAVALIASFIGWTDFPGGFSNANAWSGGDAGLNVFPLATYVPVFIIASAAISLIKKFGNVNMGLDKYIGISGHALQRAFALFALLLAFGWLLFIDDNRGFGLWLSILAAIGAVVGNVLIDHLKTSPKPAPNQWGAPAPGYPPQPGYPQQSQPGYGAPQPQPGYAAPQPPPGGPQPPPPAAPQPYPQPQPQPPAPQPAPPPPAPQQPPPPAPAPPPPAPEQPPSPPAPGTPPPPA